MYDSLTAWWTTRATNRSAMLLLLLSSGVQCAGQEARPITDAETVAAVYVENHGLSPIGPRLPNLVVVVWGDGRILWSENRIEGGAPYREGRIDPAAVTLLLTRWNEDGIFDLPDLGDARFGPDSEFTSILLRFGGKRLQMRSWHELLENVPGNVARKSGVVGGTEGRLRVLREEPADYLFYRFVWAEIRARTLSLIPRGGDAVEGEVVLRSGSVSWRPRAIER